MSWVSALLGGAAQGASNMLGGMQGYYYSRQMWQRAMDAANTAHQREVADLRAAGLNPILSATGGSGAQSFQGSAPSVGMGGVADAAINAYTAKKQLEIQDKNADANIIAAESQKRNANTAEWQMFTAEEMGSAGFAVKFLKFGKSGALGAEGDGHARIIRSLRINKVTGETYDALTGRKVEVLDELPLGSAKDVPNGEVKAYIDAPKSKRPAVLPNVRILGF